MKRILCSMSVFLLILCLAVTAFAAERQTEKVSIDPSYQEIVDLIDDVVVYTNSAIDDENREKLYIGENETLSHITKEDVDFSMICKFYRGADEILNCKTEEEILSVLENLRYNWVLPIFIDDLVLELTISKTYDFEEGEIIGLTAEEKFALVDEKGYYHISSMVLTDDVSFWTESVENGNMTYFVNLSPTAAAMQVRNNKCYLLCKQGEAAGQYVSADRIEIDAPASSELRTGISTSYTLRPPAISWTVVTISLIAALAVASFVFISSKKKKKV